MKVRRAQAQIGQGELVGQHGSRFEYVHFASAKSGTAYMPTVSNQWTDIDRRRGNQGSNGTGSVRAVATRRNLAQPHSPENTTLSTASATGGVPVDTTSATALPLATSVPAIGL